MRLDDVLLRYFATTDLAEPGAEATRAGIERTLVDFGLESDRGKRFALWSLLHLLGEAPELDVAFENPADREAARNCMDLVDAREAGLPD